MGDTKRNKSNLAVFSRGKSPILIRKMTRRHQEYKYGERTGECYKRELYVHQRDLYTQKQKGSTTESFQQKEICVYTKISMCTKKDLGKPTREIFIKTQKHMHTKRVPQRLTKELKTHKKRPMHTKREESNKRELNM